jgi:hypothetical protein
MDNNELKLSKTKDNFIRMSIPIDSQLVIRASLSGTENVINK